MIILDLAVVALARRARRAMQCLGTEMFRAIQGDEHTPIQATHRGEPAAFIHIYENKGKNTVEVICRHAIQHGANLVVARYLPHPEQRVCVRPTQPFRHQLLVMQERRTLHMENRKCRQPKIRHCINNVLAGPLIRQCRASLPKRGYVGVEMVHPPIKADSAYRRKTRLKTQYTEPTRFTRRHIECPDRYNAIANSGHQHNHQNPVKVLYLSQN